MDKFKFTFRCIKQPKPFTGLNGFEPGEVYQGRKYNGMYEIAVKWGNGEQTKLIERKLFSEFFEELSTYGEQDSKNKGNVPVHI